VMRLDLPESLARVLSSSNLIENVFSGARYRAPSKTLAGWHDDSDMDRGWRPGSRAPLPQSCRLSTLPKLVAALRAHDSAVDRQRKIDEAEKAA
jgi:hypothetical protein